MNHEIALRGRQVIDKFFTTKIFVCGAGALGGNLVESLARLQFNNIGVVDFDKVSDSNKATQPYGDADVSKSKVLSLAQNLYKNLKIRVTPFNTKLQANNLGIIGEFKPDIVVDCFDNSESRQIVYDYTMKHDIPCLHGGMIDSFGEVKWNEKYIVPKKSDMEDVCDYPLSRTLIMITSTMLLDAVISFVSTGNKRNFHIETRKFNIIEI